MQQSCAAIDFHIAEVAEVDGYDGLVWPAEVDQSLLDMSITLTSLAIELSSIS